MDKYRVDAQLLFGETDIEGGVTVTFPADSVAEATKMAQEMFNDTFSNCTAEIFAVTLSNDDEEEGE